MNLSKGYIGGDLGKGNWGVAGNASVGEEGKWKTHVGYGENDTVHLSIDNGLVSYYVNEDRSKPYFYQFKNTQNFYFTFSIYYQGDTIEIKYIKI
jgi:hypothetical protein